MTLRLGSIGFGIMGERLLRAALDHGEVEIAGVWDPSGAAMARLAAALPQVPAMASAEAVLAAADCVHIASPPAHHLGYGHAALEAGVAVFSEKPLSVDVAASRRFADRVRGGGHRAAVNFVLASSFAVDQLKDWLAEAAVGRPEALDIEVDFAAWPRPWQADAAGWLSRRAEGGFTREVISHFLFLALRLFGPLAVHEHRVSYPDGDACESSLSAALAAGSLPVTVSGRVAGTEKPDHNLFVIRGDGGAIRLRDWSIAERLDDDGHWHQAGDAIPNEVARPLVLQRQLDKLVRLTAGEEQDLASVDEALAVQEIVEAMLQP